MALFKEQPATPNQCNLISDLCLQLGISNGDRRWMCEKRYNKKITFLDELTKEQASSFIRELLVRVEETKAIRRSTYQNEENE